MVVPKIGERWRGKSTTFIHRQTARTGIAWTRSGLQQSGNGIGRGWDMHGRQHWQGKICTKICDEKYNKTQNVCNVTWTWAVVEGVVVVVVILRRVVVKDAASHIWVWCRRRVRTSVVWSVIHAVKVEQMDAWYEHDHEYDQGAKCYVLKIGIHGCSKQRLHWGDDTKQSVKWKFLVNGWQQVWVAHITAIFMDSNKFLHQKKKLV